MLLSTNGARFIVYSDRMWYRYSFSQCNNFSIAIVKFITLALPHYTKPYLTILPLIISADCRHTRRFKKSNTNLTANVSSNGKQDFRIKSFPIRRFAVEFLFVTFSILLQPLR